MGGCTSRENQGVTLVPLGERDCILKLDVIGAQGLLAGDVGGKADPYCLISFANITLKTQVVSDTLAPQWNQHLALVVKPEEAKYGINFSVHDKDQVTSSEYLGRASLESIAKYADGKNHKVTLDLELVKEGTFTKAGKITFALQVLTKDQVELAFWKHVLGDFDPDKSGDLDKEQMGLLFEGLGLSVTDEELDKQFKVADRNSDQKITAEELAAYFKGRTFEIAAAYGAAGNRERKAEREAEAVFDMANAGEKAENDAYVIGGFLTEAFAARGFASRFAHRLTPGDYKMSEESGNVYVWNRSTGAVEEEKIPGFVRLSLRAIYQNSLNLDEQVLLLKTLKHMSIRQGKAYNTKESVKHILPFIDFHQLDMTESLEPVESFKNFNEFFYRKLKPSARPIAEPDNPKLAISAADCRLMAFENLDDMTRLWIKGKQFTLAGLLANEELAKSFNGGSAVIFRLAPQDYHRFHMPVGGKLVSQTPIDGEYFTVSPMAVRADVDVFTKNKRNVAVIESPEFGRVVFVTVGATMVGSMTFTLKAGSEFKKGDEYGYFSFGGSTCICIFEPGKIKLDSDLVENSSKPLETYIKMGERLGVALS